MTPFQSSAVTPEGYKPFAEEVSYHHYNELEYTNGYILISMLKIFINTATASS